MESQPEVRDADRELDELLERTRISALRTLGERVDVEARVREVLDAVDTKRPESL